MHEQTSARETQSDEAFDSELADELEQLEYYSTSSSVEVEVISVTKTNDSVKIRFRPPVGNDFTRRWELPRSPEQETKFTAVLDHTGHRLSTADKIIGDYVLFTYTVDGWELDIPEVKPGWRDRVRNSVNTVALHDFMTGLSYIGGFAILPVIAIPLMIWLASRDRYHWIEAVYGVFLALIAWFLTLSSGLALLSAVL